jgi:hypothetical protein
MYRQSAHGAHGRHPSPQRLAANLYRIRERSMAIRLATICLLLLTVLFLPGCQVVGQIFEAGMWVGVVGVLIVLALLGFVFSRFRR